MIHFDDRPRWLTWRRAAIGSTALAFGAVVAARFADGEAPTKPVPAARATAASALPAPDRPTANGPVEAAAPAARPAEPPALTLPAAIPSSAEAPAPAASQPATREERELRESQPDGSC